VSKDPLGFDPLGIDPIEQIQRIKNVALQRSIEAFRNNILLRGTTMIDRDKPAEVKPPVGDDGQPLTKEKRREIASKRAAYDPESFGKKEDLGYAQDLQDHPVEALGESAEKAIQLQPEMTIVRPKELTLPEVPDAPKSN
jgi:hypothetical protein